MTPINWREYSRVQQLLRDRTTIDSRAWGLEAALDDVLNGNAGTNDEVELAVRNGARRERHQSLARTKNTVALERPVTSEDRVSAREALVAARQRVSGVDWHLLVATAEGEPYGALASHGSSAGALRVRVTRLRRVLQALAA